MKMAFSPRWHALLRIVSLLALTLMLAPRSAQAQPVSVPASGRLSIDGEPVPVATTLGEGFCARFAKAASGDGNAIDSIARALGVLASDAPSPPRNTDAVPFHEIVRVADLYNAANTTTVLGYLDFNQLLPWSVPTADLSENACTSYGGGLTTTRLAMRMRGDLRVDAPGTWTLAIVSDDGYRLRIGGVDILSVDQNRAPAVDTVRVTFDAAGVYPIDIVYWDQGGLAILELLYRRDAVLFEGADLRGVSMASPPELVDFIAMDFRTVDLPSWVEGEEPDCRTLAGQSQDMCVIDAPALTCGNGRLDNLPGDGVEPCDRELFAPGTGCPEGFRGERICNNDPAYDAGDGTCTLAPADVACDAIDPCAEGLDDCDDAAACTTTGPGTFTCECLEGYTGDGRTCDDVDECDEDPAPCDPLVECTNLPGGFLCAPCPETTTDVNGDGTRCEADEEAPWVVIRSPRDGSRLRVGPERVEGQTEPNLLVAVFLDDALEGETTADGDGFWELLFVEVPGPGDHVVRALATDPAGNVGEATARFSVLGADDVAILRPTEGERVRTGTPRVEGAAPPGSTVIIEVDGEEVGEAVADEDGLWTWTPDTALEDGEREIRAFVVVDDGTVGDDVTVIIDTTDAGVEITRPTDGSVTNDPRPRVEGSAPPGAELVIEVDGVEVARVTADENGAWTWEADSTLPDGERTVRVTDADSGAADEVTFTVDTTPPFLAVDEPAAGDTVPSTGGVVRGRAEPGARIVVTLDGDVVGETVAGEDGTWSVPLPDDLPGGPSDLDVRATDEAGNTTLVELAIDIAGGEPPGDTGNDAGEDAGPDAPDFEWDEGDMREPDIGRDPDTGEADTADDADPNDTGGDTADAAGDPGLGDALPEPERGGRVHGGGPSCAHVPTTPGGSLLLLAAVALALRPRRKVRVA